MLRTSTSPDRRYPTLFGRRLRDLAPDFAALSALLGFVVATVALLAYRLPLPDVVQSRPGDPALHPLLPMCVILLATAVALNPHRSRRLVDALALVVLCVAPAMSGWSVPEAGWLYHHFAVTPRLEALAAGGSGAFFSTGTSLCLGLLAAAVLLHNHRKVIASQLLAFLAFTAPALALLGFLLGLRDHFIAMPLTGVLMLIPLNAAVSLSSVHHGLLRAVIGPARVTQLARRYILLAMLAPYVLGALIVELSRSAASTAVVILVVATSQAVGLIVAFLALSFGNLERRRRVLARREAWRARHDGLTGAMNRAAFTDQASRAIRDRRARKSGTSLLFVDVDFFKRINDRFGHEAGDRVLARIIRVTRDCLRRADLVARWGGEEFVVLLPETNRGDARLIAEKIRTRISAEPLDDVAPGLRVTVSIGCAEIGRREDLNELVARADKALYEAKHRGRNQTVAA